MFAMSNTQFRNEKENKVYQLEQSADFWGVFLINVKLNLKTFWNVEKFK